VGSYTPKGNRFHTPPSRTVCSSESLPAPSGTGIRWTPDYGIGLFLSRAGFPSDDLPSWSSRQGFPVSGVGADGVAAVPAGS